MKATTNWQKSSLILAGGFALGLGILIYKKQSCSNWSLLKKTNKNEKPADSSNFDTDLSTFLKDQNYVEMLFVIKPRIQSEFSLKMLSKIGLNSVNKLVVTLIQKEYITNVALHRSQRRKYLNDPSKYVQISLKFIEENDELMELGTIEVLRDLEIDPDFFESEAKRHFESDPNVAYMNLILLENLKIKLLDKSKTSLSPIIFSEYIQYQIDHYDEIKFENSLKISPEKFMIVKQQFYSDLASVKFKLEEEDFLCRPELIMNEEMRTLYDKLQDVQQRDQSGFFDF